MANVVEFVPHLTIDEQREWLDRMNDLAYRIKRLRKNLKKAYAIRAPECVITATKNCIKQYRNEYNIKFHFVEEYGICDEYLNFDMMSFFGMM